jgi:hypothetical protein
LSDANNEILLQPFYGGGSEETMFDMKENTNPGLDGFGVSFYKICCEIIKDGLMDRS